MKPVKLVGSLLPLLLLLAFPARAQFVCLTNDDTIAIIGYNGPGGDVTIPDTIGDLPVTALGDFAFLSVTNLTSVTIGTNVTGIGSAFYNCVNLDRVSIGRSVTNLANAGNDTFCHAFLYCPRLTAIEVDALNPVYCSVNGVLFNKGTNVLLNYPDGKTGTYAVPSSVTIIGQSAFEDSNLATVILPDGVVTIPVYAFAGCSNLTTIEIPGSVSTIENGAFTRCSNLRAVTLPDSVTTLGEGVFYNCYALAAVKISNSVTNIGNGMFYCCRSLTNVVIPDSVTAIAELAFCSNSSMATLTLGRAITSIGDYAFYRCTNLTTLAIPDNVTTIGEAAFLGCKNLTNVTLGDRVATITNRAFYGCNNLKEVTIGRSISVIGDNAFGSCPNLTHVFFKGNAPSLAHPLALFNDSNATIYYLPGTADWGPTLAGRPTAPWLLPNPIILNFGSAFGVQTNRFGFIISWATNVSVVVEACTNLSNLSWEPMHTNTLTSGWSYFTDPDWTNYSGRYYRLRSP